MSDSNDLPYGSEKRNPEFNPGDKFDAYTIMRRENESLLFPLYLISDSENNHFFAQFLRKNEFESLPESLQRNTLHHKNLFKVENIIFSADVVAVIYEHFKGENLKSRLERMSRIDFVANLEIALHLIETLKTLREHRIIHKNLTPESIFITEYGTIKTAGLYSAVDMHAKSILIKEEAIGEIDYIAPEVLEGEASGQEDFYCLGAVLYFLTTGRHPLQGTSPLKIFKPKTRKEPIPVNKVNRDITEQLATIIERCMRRNPIHRSNSLTDLYERLSRVHKNYKIRKNRSYSQSNIWRKTRIPVIVLSVLVVFGGLFLSRNEKPPVSVNTSISFPTYRIDPWGNESDYNIKNRGRVYTNDAFKIVLHPESDLKLYVFNFSPDGKLHILHRKNSLNYLEIKTGEMITLPGTNEWFKFDDKPGTELLYFIFVNEEWKQLEKLAERYLNRDGYLPGIRKDLIKLLEEKSTRLSNTKIADESRRKETDKPVINIHISDSEIYIHKITLEHL